MVENFTRIGSMFFIKKKLLGIACMLFLAGCYSSLPSSNFFAYEKVSGLSEPEVIIKNHSNLAISVTITGRKSQKLELSPFCSEKLSLPPDVYTFYAESPGAMTSTIFTRIETSTRYSISFYIGTP